MAIDVMKDKLLSLKEAAKLVPTIEGKVIHHTSIWRWMHHGSLGVRLETVRVGRRIATTEQAIANYIHEVSKRDADRKEERHLW